jgi:hypothetical protein
MNHPSCSSQRHGARASFPLRPALGAALIAALSGACQPAPPRPAVAPQPDRIVTFEGSIHLGNGQALAYRAILAPDPSAPGEHVGTIDIPMQALSAASLERVVFRPGQRVEFALALPGTPRWTGEVAADGAIRCEFRQGDTRLPCSMAEARTTRDAAPVLAGDGTPPREGRQPTAER